MPVVPNRAALICRIFRKHSVVQGSKAAQVIDPSIQSVIIAKSVCFRSKGQVTDTLFPFFLQVILCFYQSGQGNLHFLTAYVGVGKESFCIRQSLFKCGSCLLCINFRINAGGLFHRFCEGIFICFCHSTVDFPFHQTNAIVVICLFCHSHTDGCGCHSVKFCGIKTVNFCFIGGWICHFTPVSFTVQIFILV